MGGKAILGLRAPKTPTVLRFNLPALINDA